VGARHYDSIVQSGIEADHPDGVHGIIDADNASANITARAWNRPALTDPMCKLADSTWCAGSEDRGKADDPESGLSPTKRLDG
jgi:hypothetical protein